MLSSQWCVCTILALFATLSISTIDAKFHPKSAQEYRTIFVDSLGTKGGFRTIQAAIDSVPSNNTGWICIQVKNGVYREQVRIPESKPFIYLKGDGQETTRVVWDARGSIATSATFSTRADYTIAKGISFFNSFSYNASNINSKLPAVAALVQGDKSAFYNCGFYGFQDTLWDVEGRHYFKRCSIEGAVDFIFGAGQSHYEECNIRFLGEALAGPGYVTAQGREREEESNGFVFKNCNLNGSGKAYLGRAWRDHARVVFYNTFMSDIVVPQGWDSWAGVGHENQLTFAENNCRGPGSVRSMRVKWAKKLSVEELKQLTRISFIDNEGWIYKLPSDFF